MVLVVEEGLFLGFKESSKPFSNDFSESERSELKLAGEMLLELIKLFLDMTFCKLRIVLVVSSHYKSKSFYWGKVPPSTAVTKASGKKALKLSLLVILNCGTPRRVERHA